MKKKTPITLLCGYLGAGKTTLLNKVLTNQKGYKVAVIVNDIGEINVDASLIAKGANITDTSSIVPLTNGCICCTLKSQMADNIEKLIAQGNYDCILIEASGVCEPMPIVQELELISNGYVDNVVGVVDALRLVDEFASGERLLEKNSIDEEDIESLLIQQIEFCSTLVINKIDLVSEAELKKIRKVVSALHPSVKIIETSYAELGVEKILGTASFDFDRVYGEAGWCRALEEGDLEGESFEGESSEEEMSEKRTFGATDEEEHHHHEHRKEGEEEDEYGIGTFIYYIRKPLNRRKFAEFVNKWPSSIIRCKGLVWFEDEYDSAYLFETSGRQVLCGPYGRWLASCSEKEIKQFLEQNSQAKADWDEELGDRMVRLCIIGRNLDKKALISSLDSCLS